MRKTVPFVLTIAVSVLCTATLVHAAGSGSESAFEPTSVAPSRVLGSGLTIEACKSSTSIACPKMLTWILCTAAPIPAVNFPWAYIGQKPRAAPN